MGSFRNWLEEVYDETRIHTNPSKGQLIASLHKSKSKELRYLHNSKTDDVHVADAYHHMHTDIAHHTGEKGFRRDFEGEPVAYKSGHFHAGAIDRYNIELIKTHPGGLKGYIKDRHKGDTDIHDWKE